MSNVIELRQYTLKSGQRDVLIELFEREFVESQEAVGISLIGLFRDLGDPDRFVWLRGFPSMEARAESLAAFYGGPIWKANREAANATMIDSDNVLLLRPARPEWDFKSAPGGSGTISATICTLTTPADDAFLSAFGKPAIAALVTKPAPNTFPALPVREGENVFVWFARETSSLPMGMRRQVIGEPVVLRLEPTARSRLR
ncbi:MAG TPA: NIPSNAP family protein [Rhizomicrobium sp.]